MKTSWKKLIIPLLSLGIVGMMALYGCKSDGTDDNPVGIAPTVKSVAANLSEYKNQGYTPFATECFDTVVGGMAAKAKNYLFIKPADTKSPMAGGKAYDTSSDFAAGNSKTPLPADTTADFDLVYVSYKLLSCDAQPLVTQKVIGVGDITGDYGNIVWGDNDIKQKKVLDWHVTDIKITPGAASIVYKFMTAKNEETTSDTLPVPRAATNFSATGFCGVTNWAVGVESDPRLPGEVPAGKPVVDSFFDMAYAAYGGLGDCSLPPKADTTHDFSAAALMSGLQVSPATLWGSIKSKKYLANYIGFDVKESTRSSDLSAKDATHDKKFMADLNTIWFLALTNPGLYASDFNMPNILANNDISCDAKPCNAVWIKGIKDIFRDKFGVNIDGSSDIETQQALKAQGDATYDAITGGIKAGLYDKLGSAVAPYSSFIGDSTHKFVKVK